MSAYVCLAENSRYLKSRIAIADDLYVLQARTYIYRSPRSKEKSYKNGYLVVKKNNKLKSFSFELYIILYKPIANTHIHNYHVMYETFACGGGDFEFIANFIS